MTGQAVEFEFTMVDSVGNEASTSREKGIHNDTELRLGQVRLPDELIQTVALQGDIIRLTWTNEDNKKLEGGFRVFQKKALAVRDSLNRTLSRRIAAAIIEMHSKKDVSFCREHECYYCHSIVVTTQPESTPQVYCTYCDSINSLNADPEITKVELQYRLCESCKLYSRPRQFSVFYFYFLIHFGGVHHKVTNRCPACMRRDAWLMLLGNLPFILGVPVAFTQLYRVYHDSIRRGPFRGLDEANLLYKRGKIEKALERYYKIIDRHPVSAGVFYNIAIGLLSQKDVEHARQVLEMSLENCANYTPSIEMLKKCESQIEG